MKNIDIIVGSMMGASEYVAERAKLILEANDFKAKLHLQPQLNELDPEAIWLVVTSTHGAGELPDNIQPLSELLAQKPQTTQQYGVIALGDSSYDTFCQGGKTIDEQLKSCGAHRLGERLEIDVLEHFVPEDYAEPWLEAWIKLLN